MTFGEFIKERREEKMLSRRAFAGLINISPAHVSYIENGQRNAPKHETLLKIVEVLNLSEQEQNKMMFLAAQTHYHSKITHELADYLFENEYAKDTLKLAQEYQITDDDWRFFTNYICNKYL